MIKSAKATKLTILMLTIVDFPAISVDTENSTKREMKMLHAATLNAFANKFGTYTGAIRNEATREIIRERFSTYDEARNWVKSKAREMFGEGNYASMRRKGEYFANFWVARS